MFHVKHSLIKYDQICLTADVSRETLNPLLDSARMAIAVYGTVMIKKTLAESDFKRKF